MRPGSRCLDPGAQHGLRDELILVLDLYVREGRRPWLSMAELRSLLA